MAFESAESVQPCSPAETRMDFRISRGEQRILHESFPFLAKIGDTERKRRIYKMLLVGGRSADEVTLSQAKDAKELEEEARNIVKFIKTGISGKLVDAIEKMRELPAPVDFRDYIDNYEAVVKNAVYELLFSDKREYAIELIKKLGEGINFSEQVRAAYFDWKRFGIHDTADKIKEAFPHIDFDTPKDQE